MQSLPLKLEEVQVREVGVEPMNPPKTVAVLSGEMRENQECIQLFLELLEHEDSEAPQSIVGQE